MMNVIMQCDITFCAASTILQRYSKKDRQFGPGSRCPACTHVHKNCALLQQFSAATINPIPHPFTTNLHKKLYPTLTRPSTSYVSLAQAFRCFMIPIVSVFWSMSFSCSLRMANEKRKSTLGPSRRKQSQIRRRVWK